MKLVSAALVMLFAPWAWAQDHEHWLLATSASVAHQSEVDHRHGEVWGVGHEATEHHFLLAKDGGSIRLEVKDPGQLEARDRIREHLRAIARAFAAGDFSMPMRIHDQVPPGVEVMKERLARSATPTPPPTRVGSCAYPPGTPRRAMPSR